MPYIDQEARDRLRRGGAAEEPGELNYQISLLVDDYLSRKGGVRYAHINEVVGVLECAKLEVYRRIAAAYEDKKRDENGDVYRVMDE